MPQGLQEATRSCPYCGENIDLLIDGSVPEQIYVEDCFVCCRPIVISACFDEDGDVVLDLRQEDD
ncbi:MAG: CPXCG motif-containing cysteine-rich protein [Oceanococcus sp.]